jgi:hypothetical protein
MVFFCISVFFLFFWLASAWAALDYDFGLRA